MGKLHSMLTRLYVVLLAVLAVPRRRNERGDVPGWVMITVMSAGLVGALVLIARPQLSAMLRNALNSVN